MKESMVRKGLVLGIIVLFAGAGVTPSISGNIEKINSLLSAEEVLGKDRQNSEYMDRNGTLDHTLFYDDFEDGTLDKWTVISGNWEIIMEGGNHVAHLNRTSSLINRRIVSTGAISNHAIITAIVKGDATGDEADTSVGFYSNSDGTYFYYVNLGGDYLGLRKFEDGSTTHLDDNAAVYSENNVWYNVKIKLDSPNIYAKRWEIGSSEPSEWQVSYDAVAPYGTHLILGGISGIHNEEFWFDDIFVIGGGDSGLVSYWNFDEGSGSTVYDSEGKPIENAIVFAVEDGNPLKEEYRVGSTFWQSSGKALTGPSGGYYIGMLASGTYDLCALANGEYIVRRWNESIDDYDDWEYQAYGYYNRTRDNDTISLGNEMLNADFCLNDSWATIRGHVYNASGNISGAAVCMELTSPSWMVGYTATYGYTYTDCNGDYYVRVPTSQSGVNNNYRVRASKVGHLINEAYINVQGGGTYWHNVSLTPSTAANVLMVFEWDYDETQGAGSTIGGTYNHMFNDALNDSGCTGSYDTWNISWNNGSFMYSDETHYQPLLSDMMPYDVVLFFYEDCNIYPEKTFPNANAEHIKAYLKAGGSVGMFAHEWVYGAGENTDLMLNYFFATSIDDDGASDATTLAGVANDPISGDWSTFTLTTDHKYEDKIEGDVNIFEKTNGPDRWCAIRSDENTRSWKSTWFGFCITDFTGISGTADSDFKDLINNTVCWLANYAPTISFSDINGVTEPERHIFVKNDPPASTTLKINGTAYDPDGWVFGVKVKIDNGEWQDASGDIPITTWSYDWNIFGVDDGKHTISVTCMDNEWQWSETVSKTVHINKMEFHPPYHIKDITYVFSGGAKSYPETKNWDNYCYIKNEEHTYVVGWGGERSWKAREAYALPSGTSHIPEPSKGDGFTVDKNGLYNVKLHLNTFGWYYGDSWTAPMIIIPSGFAGSVGFVLSGMSLIDTTTGKDSNGIWPTVNNAEKIRVDEDSSDIASAWIQGLISLIPVNEILDLIRELIFEGAFGGRSEKDWRIFNSCVFDNPIYLEAGHTYIPVYSISSISSASFCGGAASAYMKTYASENLQYFVVEKCESALENNFERETENEVGNSILSVQPVTRNSIIVDDEGDGDYDNIQDAIDNASAGDTIEVYSGTYTDPIIINKELQIIGIPYEFGNGSDIGNPVINTTIVANTAVSLFADNCIFSDFKIEDNQIGLKLQNASNNNVSSNEFVNNSVGLTLINASENNIFSNNNFSFNQFGIWSSNSANNTYYNNIIEFNRLALMIDDFSNSTLVTNNSISKNGYGTIIMSSYDNKIFNNQINLNLDSIALVKSSSNEISNNTFNTSSRCGLTLTESFNNSIINNSFNTSGISFSSHNCSWQSQFIQGNTINGKPIYHYANINGNDATVPSDAGQVILVNCTNFEIKNLNISNTDYAIQLQSSSNILITHNILSNNLYGILLANSTNNTISNTILSNNTLGGIIIQDSSTNLISNNTMINDGINLYGDSQNDWTTQIIFNNTINNTPLYYYTNEKDITVPTDAGQIILANCSNFSLKNINLFDVEYGIQLAYTNNITISQCNISRCVVGITLQHYTKNNIICNNNIINCSAGLTICNYSSNNMIYHNRFSNNSQNAFDNCTNNWDYGYPSGGNYWADYGGVDVDGDGIGDTSYAIPDASNQDRYPLGYFTNNVPVADFTYTPSSPIALDVIQFNDTSFDVNGSIDSWLWDFGDGNTSVHPNPTHHYADNGTYAVNLTVADEYGIDNNTQKIIVVSNAAPFADFLYGPLSPAVNDTIYFHDFSYDLDGYIVNWTWNFGDGNISYEQNPIHQYAIIGTYDVVLTVKDDDGATDSTSDNVTIHDDNDPEISNVQAIPSEQVMGGYVNISAQVIDNIEINEVYLYIEYPGSIIENVLIKRGGIYSITKRGTIENFSITQNRTGDTYYCNKTYQQPGMYTYHIWANDTSGNANVSADYTFEIINNPPNTPSDPNPENGATGVDNNADLSWNCSDPDGHSLTYDVYFEADDPTPDVLVSDDQSETTYDPGTLEYETTYYWQIIAKDEYGATTDGPIWHFTTEEEAVPDLDCEGSLSWTNVEPGSTVTGSFTVKNIGDPGSELDWEIIEWPEWGDWSFDPDSGTGLPDGGSETVDVEVAAPNDPNTEFTGEVKVINSDDPNDYCTIPVYLKTPVNQPSTNQQILKTILQQFLSFKQIN